jgi:Intraflagellar transport complex B, subunit 20
VLGCHGNGYPGDERSLLLQNIEIMELEKSIEDQLSAQGIFIDDVHRLRILEPTSADQTQKFKEECDRFTQSKRLAVTCVSSYLCADVDF